MFPETPIANRWTGGDKRGMGVNQTRTQARSRSVSGAVAAGHDLCAEAATEILAEGGNAFDAAIAALWTACVVEPVLASPGGGGFLMARSETGPVSLYDFFVNTPRRKRPQDALEFERVEADFGTTTQTFHIGAGAAATPGFVPGLFAIHAERGRLPMQRLTEPAVRAARDGVIVTPFQAYLAEVVAPILTWSQETRALYAPGGALLKDGDRFANPALADTLDIVGREGVRIVTEGEIAAAMAEATREAGHLERADFSAYAVERRSPVMRRSFGWQVALNPPPALGGALIAAMLDEVALQRTGDPATLALAIDRIDRHWRIVPTDPYRLLSQTDPDHYHADGVGSGGITTRGTTHVSVVDEDGNIAAATVSNGEGNGRIVPGCGFMLNNMLGEDDVNPAGFHMWQPGQRLSSMMAPTLASRSDGTLVALGSGGSNRIRTAILQVLALRLRDGMPLQEAVVAPRLHVERGHCDFEDQFPGDARKALRAAFRDHRAWGEQSLYFGGVHAVERTARGRFTAAGDPRRAGSARIV